MLTTNSADYLEQHDFWGETLLLSSFKTYFIDRWIDQSSILFYFIQKKADISKYLPNSHQYNLNG